MDGNKKAVPERIYFLVPPLRFEKSLIGVVVQLELIDYATCYMQALCLEPTKVELESGFWFLPTSSTAEVSIRLC